MQEFILFLRGFSIWTVLIRLVLALIFGGLIGAERERNGSAAGFRTHILVAMGSAMAVLVGLFAIKIAGLDTDPLRIAAQVVSGIGFLGMGTILVVGSRHVTGLTTAAGLWSTATIGLAFGIGFYEGAVICAVMLLFVIWGLKFFDNHIMKKNNKVSIYLEVKNADRTNDTLASINALGIQILRTEVNPPRSGITGAVGLIAYVKLPEPEKAAAVSAISGLDTVSFALEN